MDNELLPIGQFARLSRLSVKQLRHYDEIGLLRPAHVDDQTGYRYYRASQARQALSIGLLRSMDVPLPIVAQVLAGTPAALASVRDDLEAELDRRRHTLASLEQVMRQGLPATPVRKVHEPPLQVALVHENAAGPRDIGRATSAAVARVLRHTSARPGGPGGPGGVRLIGLFPVDLGDIIDVAVAIVLDPDATRPETKTQAETGTEIRELAGGPFARATHIGPYDHIPLTTHALLAWCAERRLPIRGPLREVYVSDPARTPPEQLTTHLMIPLEEDS
ncbi:MerR family transcriptional regulator [Nonomuraea sp. NPDC002799]